MITQKTKNRSGLKKIYIKKGEKKGRGGGAQWRLKLYIIQLRKGLNGILNEDTLWPKNVENV